MEKHTKHFSIKAAFKKAWSLFWKNPWVYLGVVGFGVLTTLLQPQGVFENPSIFMQFILFLWAAFLWALGVVVTIGSAYITIKAARGKEPVFKDLWARMGLFWRYLVMSVLLAVAMGLVLGVVMVPAILLTSLGLPRMAVFGVGILLASIIVAYLGLSFMFYVYVIIDHPKDSVREQIRRAWAMTDGVKLKILQYIFVQLGVIILGLLLLGVGLLVAIPVASLATALIYESLKKQSSYKPKKIQHDQD